MLDAPKVTLGYGQRVRQFARVLIQNCSTNIQLVSNTWSRDSRGVSVFDYGFNCPNTNKRISIDRNVFVSRQPAWSEGKIGLVEVYGVTMTNKQRAA